MSGMKKNKRMKDVMYPILQECCVLLTTDEFWTNTFDELSRGKCPKGITMFNGVLSSTYKRNGFSYHFMKEGLTPEQIVEELTNLLKKNAYMYSEKDMIQSKEDLNSANNEYINAKNLDDWKKIKSRKMKDNLITNFAVRMKAKYKLNYRKARTLYKMIESALFVYKTHRSEDIVMDGGEIKSINDIVYDKKYKLFMNQRIFDMEEEEVVDKKEKRVLKTNWFNYIKNAAKHIQELINTD